MWEEEVKKGIKKPGYKSSKAWVRSHCSKDLVECKNVLTGVEDSPRIEPTSDRNSRDQRVPDCHRDNNIDKGHDESASVLEDVIAPLSSCFAQELLWLSKFCQEWLSVPAASSDGLKRLDVISIATFKNLDIRISDESPAYAAKLRVAKYQQSRLLEKLSEQLMCCCHADGARLGRSNANLGCKDSA